MQNKFTVLNRNKIITLDYFIFVFQKSTNTYGSFIFINIQHVKKEIRIDKKPTAIKRTLFNLGVVGLCV